MGYKAHIGVDQGMDLIRGAILTGADVGDSLVADALIQGDEAVVYADKAYDSQARREALGPCYSRAAPSMSFPALTSKSVLPTVEQSKTRLATIL